tara:strand:- start:433 stop:663 length:231 start_codon:yes stop_codon:yes gene_type:complete
MITPIIVIIIPKMNKNPEVIKGTAIFIIEELRFEIELGSSENIITKSNVRVAVFSILKFKISDFLIKIVSNKIESS